MTVVMRGGGLISAKNSEGSQESGMNPTPIAFFLTVLPSLSVTMSEFAVRAKQNEVTKAPTF
jgi:hypothetical protein